jgi:L-ascorbate metabolism protein UlaG (beta-lactamase superfamily)
MPVSGQSSHPKSSNYTSYIIEVDDFTIFHAGDSGNIDEYEQLTCEIDLALLPLGPGCQTMTGIDVVSAIETIEPSYFIPIHFTEDGKGLFISQYIEYFDSYKFS